MQPKEKRRRRRHTPAFKAAAVAACRKTGASVAAVALELQLNANMLRTWIKQSPSEAVIPKPMPPPEQAPTTTPAFLPVPLPARTESPSTERPIRVHIRKGRSRITIEWPTTAAGACATWLRELLG
jgi:transposase-like protein